MFEIHIDANIENQPLGSYTTAQKRADFQTAPDGDPWRNYDNRPSHPVVVSFGDNNKALRNEYLQGTWGGNSGSMWGCPIVSRDEYYLQYRWRYQPNWEWGRGNKFPGLRAAPSFGAGGNGNQSGNFGGATIRMQTNNNGLLRWYVYHYDATSIWGENLGWNGFQMQRGVWYTIIMRVVQNTIGQSNGILQVWVDGVLRNTQSNMVFRLQETQESSKQFNQISVETQMGGGDSSFAAPQDQYTWMDDFYLWNYSSAYLSANPSVPRGNQVWTAQQTLIDPYTESLGGNPPPDPEDPNPTPPPTTKNPLVYMKVISSNAQLPSTPPPDPVSPEFNVRMSIDFENNTLGEYQLSEWRQDWNNSGSPWSGLSRHTIVNEQGRKCLREFFPNGTWGGQNGSNWNGIIPNSTGLTEVYYSYKLFLDPDWFWGLGAKMSGIRTTPNSVAGGIRESEFTSDRGISLRMMNNSGGTMRFYSYHHGMPFNANDALTYAHNMGLSNWGSLPRGQWVDITVRYVMNTVGQNNGIIQFFMNHQLIASASNGGFRTSNSPQFFNEVFFCTFMGGGDSSWATNRDQYILTDDIKVWTYDQQYLTDNPSVPRGLQLWTGAQNFISPNS